jgi:hypothetical protein
MADDSGKTLLQVLDYLQPWLAAVLGFAAGLLGPIIIDRNRRKLDAADSYAAVLLELSELRFRLATTIFAVLMDAGKLTRDDLKMIYAAVRHYEETNHTDPIAVGVGNILHFTDDELHALSAMKAATRVRESVGKGLKKSTAPVLEATLQKLPALPARVRNTLLEIKANLAIFNEEIDRQRFYFQLTFQDLKPENHLIATQTTHSSEEHVGDRARIIVRKISSIPELALPEYPLPPRPPELDLKERG